MATLANASLWHDVGFGLLLTVLFLVAAELLARHVEAGAGRRRTGASGRAARMSTDRIAIADERA